MYFQDSKLVFFSFLSYSNLPSICLLEGTIIDKINPLSAKFTKRSNTLKQFVGNLPTNCLSVFDRFVGLALKG